MSGPNDMSGFADLLWAVIENLPRLEPAFMVLLPIFLILGLLKMFGQC